MVNTVKTRDHLKLEDYAAVPHLSVGLRALKDEAESILPHLKGRRIWMINSTERGGGVAEMLPKMVSILEELGLPTRWVVMTSDRPEFFVLTKRIHNLIHGFGETGLTPEDRQLYERVNRENAEALLPDLSSDDIVVVHDPQPMAMGSILKQSRGVGTIWRCHIGLDRRTSETRSAWEFLRSYGDGYDHAIFSAPEYIPDYLAGRSSIIYPALDPLSHKNRELSAHKVVGILCNAHLAVDHHPVLTPSFPDPCLRLSPNGRFVPVSDSQEIGLLYRPIITQVSRWDQLKGFKPLMDAFVRLKETYGTETSTAIRHRRRLEIARLVLAGPEAASIQDDPEARGVLDDLVSVYRDLAPQHQTDIAIITLPMASRKNNALIVNALQRSSTVVVQNSLREGFGLTLTEAMWKRRAVIATRACGLRQQVRDGIDGWLVYDPEDPDEIARTLNTVLMRPSRQSRCAGNAQRRVYDEFLIFTQIRRWLRCLHDRFAR